MSSSNYNWVDPATPGDRSGWLSCAIAIFLGTSLLTLIVRAWIRFSSHGPWGHDDTAVLLSFIVAVAQVAATTHAEQVGYGQRFSTLDDAEINDIQKSLFAAELLYITSILLSRLSTALLISRLTRYRPHIKAAIAVGSVTLVWFVASMLLISLRGDLSQPWATMDRTYALWYRWIGVELVGLMIEAALFACSIYLVWGLHMATLLRAMILLAFACRLVMVPIIAVRLEYLAPAQNDDPTFDSIVGSIITQVSMHYSTFGASIICIKPFIRAFKPGYVLHTAGDPETDTSLPSNSQRDRIRMLNPHSRSSRAQLHTPSTNSSAKRLAHPPTRGDSAEDSDFRGDRGIWSAGATSRLSGDDLERSCSGPELTGDTIRQTRVWTAQRMAR